MKNTNMKLLLGMIMVLPVIACVLCLFDCWILKVLGIFCSLLVSICNYYTNKQQFQQKNNMEKLVSGLGRKFDEKGDLKEGGNIINGQEIKVNKNI